MPADLIERRITVLLTSEKIAVLAPMPSASDTTATTVTTGEARNVRTARRRFCIEPAANYCANRPHGQGSDEP
jgi:hypothetical protein